MRDGGTASGELLGTWQTRGDVEKLDESRDGRTIIHSDPKTGLEGRCVAVEYRDFPVDTAGTRDMVIEEAADRCGQKLTP